MRVRPYIPNKDYENISNRLTMKERMRFGVQTVCYNPEISHIS